MKSSSRPTMHDCMISLLDSVNELRVQLEEVKTAIAELNAKKVKPVKAKAARAKKGSSS